MNNYFYLQQKADSSGVKHFPKFAKFTNSFGTNKSPL